MSKCATARHSVKAFAATQAHNLDALRRKTPSRRKSMSQDFRHPRAVSPRPNPALERMAGS